MSRKIIGVTVGTQLPKPNFHQTDPTKGDYIKGDRSFLEIDASLTQTGHPADAKAIGDRLADLGTQFNNLSDLVGDSSVSEQVIEGVANIVANAPEDFDTLKEIADWISQDDTRTFDLVQRIEGVEDDIEELRLFDVQADWSQTDETAIDFIKNKPRAITNEEIDAICNVVIQTGEEVEL